MATLDDIVGEEYALLLAPTPADVDARCGVLISRACARGRPPFVVVLADGPGVAASRNAAAAVGLPEDRLLMLGLRPAAVADVLAGMELFQRAVEAMLLLTWMKDCNVICTLSAADAAGQACHAVAAEVAARSGLAHLVP